MSKDGRNWYAVYTRPRWEKKVYALLTEKAVEAYCPLNRVRKKWSDRIKWVEEPLFKSYVFVKVQEAEMTKVRLVNGVVNYVYWLGKPAIIREKEIEIIRKFMNDYTEVVVTRTEVKEDDQVIIRRGAFMDKEAKVIKVLNNKVRVVIESIGFTLIATIEKSNAALRGIF
jgi:transcription antitermination factor NusG